MATAKQPTQISKLTDDDLRRMVKQDPVRPGPARYRVVVDEVMDLPIWPIIGQLKAVTGQSDPDLRIFVSCMRPSISGMVDGASEPFSVITASSSCRTIPRKT